MVGVVDHVVRVQDGVRGQVAQRQMQDHLVGGAVRMGGEVEPVRGIGRGDRDRVGRQRLGQAARGAAQPRPLGPQLFAELGGEDLGPAGHGVLEDHGPQLGMGQEQEVQDPAVDGAAADQADGVHRTGLAVQRPAGECRRRGGTGCRDLAALQDGERVAGVEIVEDLHRGGPLEPLLDVGGEGRDPLQAHHGLGSAEVGGQGDDAGAGVAGRAQEAGERHFRTALAVQYVRGADGVEHGGVEAGERGGDVLATEDSHGGSVPLQVGG